ncbi:MAG: hypothetical protein ACOC12_01585 [Bacteroidota bacterium]
MEFIDFLKYGAIGVSLALAILSFRLLSKEQEQSAVRKPVLNTIKVYFFMAVFLSFFFGVIEVITFSIGQKSSSTNQALESLWNEHFEGYPDTTLEEKKARISRHIVLQPETPDTTSICRDYILAIEDYKNELAKYDRGFYQNIIKLQNSINKDPDGWINITYRTQTKAEVISSLKGIFSSLGRNYDNLTEQEVAEQWMQFKQGWAEDQLEYVFKSDLTMVVRVFLDTFSE